MFCTRISILFILFYFSLMAVGKAECPYIVLNHTDVTQDLANAIGKIVQKAEKSKTNNMHYEDCRKIALEILLHYRELTGSYDQAYAQYRIDHLTKFFKDSEDDKKMKFMIRLVQDMGGKKLYEKYFQQEKEFDNGPDIQNLRKEVERQILSRYKALVRNMKRSSSASPPFTFIPKIKCGNDEVSTEVLPKMIITRGEITLSNQCIRFNYDYQDYPTEMSRMIFKIGDGKIEIWNCEQEFKTEFMPPKGKRVGYLKVDGTANCLGYDVVSGRYLDNSSLYGHEDIHLTFIDRMEKYYLEKGFDKTDPLKTPPQFVEFMGQRALTFDQFYDQNIPSKCKFWISIKDEYRPSSKYSYAQ